MNEIKYFWSGLTDFKKIKKQPDYGIFSDFSEFSEETFRFKVLVLKLVHFCKLEQQYGSHDKE